MNPTLLTFNNGEVSPYLRHRIDVDKMAASAETFENFIATPYGAASKRPGLVHVGMTQAAEQNSHLFPFISTDGSRYLLHFTADLLTIYRTDGTVADTIAFLTTTAPDVQNIGTITGTTTPDASCTFTRIIEEGEENGPFYCSEATADTFPNVSILWAAPNYVLRVSTGASLTPYATWISENTTLAAAPDPSYVTTWTPSFAVGMSAATGTPVVTYAPPTTGFWSSPLREIQIEAVNDVLFITHPDTHPLRISRLSDTNWIKEFIPFTQPPVLDDNENRNIRLSILSNPIAAAWQTSTSYALGAVVFGSGAEWQCTFGHTSAADTEPVIGALWKGVWRRKLYSAGAPITISPVNEDITNLIRTYLFEETATAEGSGVIYICTANHTPNGWAEEPNRAADAALYGIPHHWSQVLGSAGVSRPAGSYCTSTGGHIHRNISGAPAANSPSTATSNATWQYIRPLTADYAWEDDTIAGVLTGNIYSYLGMAYRALDDISLAWRASGATPYTNSGTIGGVFREWNTGLETDFTDTDLWEPVEFFLPGHGSSSNSPGSAWKLSPRRDDKDFQISHGALQSNNNKGSQPIAVQGAWNVNTFGTWSGVFTVQRSFDNGIEWETIRSYESKSDRNIADSGTEDIPVLLRLFFQQDASTGTTGTQRAVLTPEVQSITGYVQADTYINSATMTGIATTPVMSGLTENWAEGAFSTVKGFPRTLALHESRLAFASTTSNPVSLWFSQTDDLLNFAQGVEDTDSIYITLAAPFQYPIRWIESQRRLFIGTSTALWVAGSETSDAALTPSNFNARTYAATGTSTLRPLLAADSLFYLDRKGSRLHQVSFSAELESYEPTDLSRLAEHLTQPGLAQIAWQQTREPSLWAITREGNLLQFCYSRRDNLMAWSRHNTDGGTFLNVAILPSDNGDDDLFFIVKRAGGTALERFPQHYQEIQETGRIPGLIDNQLFPYHYLDGLAYTGPTTTSLTIPATLIGQQLTLITVAANGIATISTVTPSASPLTIASTTRAILGKPITSRLSSLPVDFPGTQSLTKRLHKIAISLYRSLGGRMHNARAASAQPIPYASTADLYTGWAEMLPDLGNLSEVQVNITHADPYPFTVRAVSLRMKQTEG